MQPLRTPQAEQPAFDADAIAAKVRDMREQELARQQGGAEAPETTDAHIRHARRERRIRKVEQAIERQTAREMLEQRAAAYRNGDRLERMSRDGESEPWEVAQATDSLVFLRSEDGKRWASMTREEAALEVRAAELGHQVAKYWDSVLATTDAIADEWKSVKAAKLLEHYKADVLEMAAMRMAAEEDADPENALHAAMIRIIGEHAEQREEAKGAALKRALEVNARMLQERYGSDAFDDEKTVASVTEGTGAMANPHRVSSERHADAPKEHSNGEDQVLRALAAGRAEAAALATHGATLTEVAKGEISAIAALEEMLSVPTERMDNEALNEQYHRLRELREKINHEPDETLRYAALLDIQARTSVLLAEHASRQAEQLGIVQQTLAELQARKPHERKPGRPVDVGKLMYQLSLRNRELQQFDPGDSERQTLDQEAWELEKRILAATGQTDALRPEKFSTHYGRLKECLTAENMTADQVAAELERISADPSLSAREKEGLRILTRELDERARDTSLASSMEYLEPAARSHLPDHEPVPEDEEGAPAPVEPPPAPIPEMPRPLVPVDRAKKARDKRVGKDTMRSIVEQEDIKRALGETNALGPEVETTLENRDNERMLRPEYSPSKRAIDSEDNWMDEGRSGEYVTTYAPTAKQRERSAAPRYTGAMGGDRMYADINAESPVVENEPLRRVADHFGGPQEFKRLHDELQQAGIKTFDWKKLRSAEHMSAAAINQRVERVAQAVRTMEARRGAAVDLKKEMPPTPYEQIAEEFGGEKLFEGIYRDLRDKGLMPLALEKLRTIRPPSLWRRLIPGMNPVNRAIRDIRNAIARSEKPWHEVEEPDTYEKS